MDSSKIQHIYEVTAEVCNTVTSEFETWIVHHVRDIVALENGNVFSKGNINKLDNTLLLSAKEVSELPQPTTTTYVMQYYAVTEKSIQTYIEKHAQNLRQGSAKFGDKLKTTRRALVEMKSVHCPPQTSNFGYVF